MDTKATMWEIPVAIATKSSGFAEHYPVLWMGKDTLLTSHLVDTRSWIVVNPDAFGTSNDVVQPILHFILFRSTFNNVI